VIGSNATLEDFLVEWWDTYAVTHLRPNTLATYTTLLDKWIIPYLGRKRLREITRETIDNYSARIRVDGAGPPTINRALGVLQGVFHRAVEWRRLSWNPVVGVRRVAHSRAETIDARTPETIEMIRRCLDQQNAVLVSVLAYEGLRPAEAYALIWGDVIDDRGKPRKRLRVERAISGDEVSTTKSERGREPDLFKPVARELLELYLAGGRPDPSALVFPDVEAATCAGRTGAAASGSPRSSAPECRTSAATTSAPPARPCCSTKAARSTRSPSTSATPTPASRPARTRT
jgi:integrase